MDVYLVLMNNLMYCQVFGRVIDEFILWTFFHYFIIYATSLFVLIWNMSWISFFLYTLTGRK